MAEGIDRERENIEIAIAAAKERIEECKRQAREADIREKQELLDLRTKVTEAADEQRKLVIVLYIMLGILALVGGSMLVLGSNSITTSSALFVGVCAFIYFVVISTKGPYPVVSRAADAERARIALKKKNHLSILDEERRDCEETITFQTAALEDMKRRTPDA